MLMRAEESWHPDDVAHLHPSPTLTAPNAAKSDAATQTTARCLWVRRQCSRTSCLMSTLRI